MMRKILFSIAVLTATTLGACENAKEELGLTRSAPDEFAVVKRAPLEMPPEFSLRPPEPGAPRPQEMKTDDQARSAVLGASPASQDTGITRGEAALLNTLQASSDPDIRGTVDREAANAKDKDQPVVKKILNIGKDQQPPAKIVDPKAEAERLKQNAASGKPVTEGATPAIED